MQAATRRRLPRKEWFASPIRGKPSGPLQKSDAARDGSRQAATRPTRCPRFLESSHSSVWFACSPPGSPRAPVRKTSVGAATPTEAPRRTKTTRRRSARVARRPVGPSVRARRFPARKLRPSPIAPNEGAATFRRFARAPRWGAAPSAKRRATTCRAAAGRSPSATTRAQVEPWPATSGRSPATAMRSSERADAGT